MKPEPLLKVENTDLTVLLSKIHAFAGEYTTDIHKERVVGDFVELNRRELQLDILHHSIYPHSY